MAARVTKQTPTASLRSYGRNRGWSGRAYGYTVLTFAEAMEIKKSTSFVRIFDAVRPDESEYLFDKANRSVSAQSGPTLVRMRRALLRALRPRTVGQLRPQMGAIFNDLLDNLDLLGSPDIVRDAVERYPGLVMAPILGVPFAETRELDHWASTINILGNHPAYAARLGDVEQAYRNMEAYLREVIADRGPIRAPTSWANLSLAPTRTRRSVRTSCSCWPTPSSMPASTMSVRSWP